MKISVIIPVYNAEKYLPVCLESLAIQTLADFEVIVVDDCSTDSSLTIAESYLEKFGGRLKIIKLQKNSGGGGYFPRNVGFEQADGEYVYFVDADDFLVDTALETLVNAAENFQPDVIYTERGFTCGAEPVPQELTESFWNPPNFSHEEPVWETADIGERVEKIINLAYGLTPWSKFVRRDFLIANDIIFPLLKTSGDVLWTFKVICLAKKLLRITPPLYVYRSPENSWSRAKRPPEDEIKFWLNPIVNGFNYLERFTRSVDFFGKNPEYQFVLFRFFETWNFRRMKESLKSFNPEELYEILLCELSKSESSNPALISYLFVMMNLYRNELTK